MPLGSSTKPFPSEDVFQSTFPYFPNEIWLKVFEHVSFIPGALTTSDFSAVEAFSTDTEGICIHRRYYQAMETKISMSFVNSTWRALVLPFLFEYIIIKSPRHALKIASAVEAIGETQPRQWIKRVEIATDHRQWWEEHHHLALLHIVKNAPNLVVFSDMFSTVVTGALDFPPLFDTLSNLCTHGSLCRFELCHISLQEIPSVLSLLKKLEVLMLFGPWKSAAIYSVVCLPRLKCLILGPRTPLTLVRYLQAPLLMGGIFHPNFHPCFDIEDLHAQNPTNLKTLRISLFCSDPHFVQSIIASCISLQRLTMNFYGINSLHEWTFDLMPHCALERVNIIGLKFFSISLDGYSSLGRDQCDGLCLFLSSLIDQENLPSLRAIGFCLPALSKQHEGPAPAAFTRLWDPWMNACEARGITVEAAVGMDDQSADIWRPFHPGLLHRALS